MAFGQELVKLFTATSQSGTWDFGEPVEVTLTFSDTAGDMSAFTVAISASPDGGTTYCSANANVTNATSVRIVKLAGLVSNIKVATSSTFTGTSLGVYASWNTRI